MIEELIEYLLRNGWAQDIAEKIDVAYYLGNMQLVRETFRVSNVFSKVINDVMNWQIEVGEMRNLWICKDRMFVIRH